MPELAISCLACKERVAYQRGVCSRCYHRLRQLVAAGQATWEELERAGRMLPVQRRVELQFGP